MEIILLIIILTTIVFIIKEYLKSPKKDNNINTFDSIKTESNKPKNINQFERVTILSEQKGRPLSRETLRNINENRNNSYSRVKNTFFDLPCHNEELIFEDTEDEDFIFTKVVGVTQKNDDDVERQEILKYCYEGEKLILEYDFHNKYSKYAIKVCRANNGEQIGYLEDSLAKKMKNREIEKFEVVLKEVTGGTVDKPNLGCNIKIIFTA